MGLDMYLYKETYEIGYWRKANAIHNWFVKNLADDVDNCQKVYVSSDNLQELLDTVNKVLASIELVDAKIANGQTLKNGQWETVWVDGQTIKDSSVAERLLPTGSGFFFGSTDYDQYYVDDLEETKKILEVALAEDGEYYYQASW